MQATPNQPFQFQSSINRQLLAVGDDQGTVHVMEVPRILRRAANNEKTFTITFFEREVKRVEYGQRRIEQRKEQVVSSSLSAQASIAQVLLLTFAWLSHFTCHTSIIIPCHCLRTKVQLDKAELDAAKETEPTDKAAKEDELLELTFRAVRSIYRSLADEVIHGSEILKGVGSVHDSKVF